MRLIASLISFAALVSSANATPTPLTNSLPRSSNSCSGKVAGAACVNNKTGIIGFLETGPGMCMTTMKGYTYCNTCRLTTESFACMTDSDDGLPDTAGYCFKGVCTALGSCSSSSSKPKGGWCVTSSNVAGHCMGGGCFTCKGAANGSPCTTFSGASGVCQAGKNGTSNAYCNTCRNTADNRLCALDSGATGVCVKQVCTVPPPSPPIKPKPPVKATPPKPAKANPPPKPAKRA